MSAEDSSVDQRPVRIGIVGTGGIAAVHAENVAQLNGSARIVAAADIDRARVEEFARTWGITATFPDLDHMLSGAELDIVHLCSPPGLHREQAVAALAMGIDVLSEKPPALSLAELDEIISAESSGGARFAVISQHRFGDRAQWLRGAVDSGVLGRPLTAVCNTLWYRPDAYFDVPWRGSWEAEGGGPTMGHGIHQMDTLLSILGPWHEAVAVAARAARATETEDVSHAILTLENGATVSVVNSFLSPRETSYLRFDFERATVELEHLYGYTEDSWRFTVAPDASEEERVRLEDEWARGRGGHGSGHVAQFARVVDAIRSSSPLPVTSADARQTLELIAAIYDSAFTGRRVRRGEIDSSSPFYRSMNGGVPPWQT